MPERLVSGNLEEEVPVEVNPKIVGELKRQYRLLTTVWNFTHGSFSCRSRSESTACFPISKGYSLLISVEVNAEVDFVSENYPRPTAAPVPA